MVSMNKFLQEYNCNTGIKFPDVIQWSCCKISKKPTVSLLCTLTGLWLSIRTVFFFSIQKMSEFVFLCVGFFFFCYRITSSHNLCRALSLHSNLASFSSPLFFLLPSQWFLIRLSTTSFNHYRFLMSLNLRISHFLPHSGIFSDVLVKSFSLHCKPLFLFSPTICLGKQLFPSYFKSA